LGILERRLSVQDMFQIQMAEAMISKGKTVPMKLNQCQAGKLALISASATVGHAE